MGYDVNGISMLPVHQDGKGSVTRLGRYEILAPVGSGGMATIYLSKIDGPAGFEKPLALKVIHSHLVEDNQFVQMFFDEARIASQLQHPNIVQIFELGESDGTYFIAMEYLRGENVGTLIQQVVKDGTRLMDPRVACHIIMEAAEGLHYAHELTSLDGQPLRLVHRDISPQNLFVTYSGSVKLMDFGIARAVGLAHSTRPGSLKGKFSYMSPEQVRGREIDSRSDIFGMGIVLWEMLSGRRLFKGRNDLESLRLVGEAEVPPLGTLRSGVPPELERVLERALAKEPENRYSTALDFHSDLGLVMDRLGSSITTHELAKRMKGWFEEQIEKKRLLMLNSVSTGNAVNPRQNIILSPPSIEGTPSVSEPSGIRVRDMLETSSDSTTPSHSGTWDGDFSSDSNNAVIPFDISGDTDPGFEDQGQLDSFNEPAPRNHVKTLAIILCTLVGLAAISIAVVFILMDLNRTQPSPSRQDMGLIGSKDSETDDRSRPAPVKIPTPEKVPVAEAPPIPIGGEGDTKVAQTVNVKLTINASSARVSIDGESQEDPSSFTLKRSSRPVKVVVSAPRHVSESFSITPEQDLSRQVELRRRTQRKQGQRPSKESGLINSPYR